MQVREEVQRQAMHFLQRCGWGELNETRSHGENHLCGNGKGRGWDAGYVEAEGNVRE